MKFLVLIIRVVTYLVTARKILFCVALPLLLGTACAPTEMPVEKSLEMIWWNDLHAQAQLIEDKNRSIFAIRLTLTNRSVKDTAIVKWDVERGRSFSLLFGPAALNASKLETSPIQTIEATPLVTDAEPAIVTKSAEIAPAGKLSFCVKLEDYVLPNQIITPANKQSMLFKFVSKLAWRRATGLVTPFGRENATDYKIHHNFDFPRFDFGDQKIAIHKNLTCEDAGK